MANQGVDISLIGDKALMRKLARLPDAVEKKIVRKVLRDHAKVVKARVVALVPVRTGNLKAAYANSKIQSAGKRGLIRVGITYPTRQELGIAEDSRWFYPRHVEYGEGFGPARPHLRPAIDNYRESDRRTIGSAIGRAIEREAAR